NHFLQEDNELLRVLVEELAERVDQQDAKITEVTKLARTDQLTGINNRYAFDEDLSKYFESAREAEDKRQVGLGYVDLDAFKQANDRFGHAYGDELLIQAATVMSKIVKPFGTVY